MTRITSSVPARGRDLVRPISFVSSPHVGYSQPCNVRQLLRQSTVQITVRQRTERTWVIVKCTDGEKKSSSTEPGKARNLDSIESLVRNNIQKMKIDMANEIIDAGRFDQETSMESRRATLEALLQDEDRLKVTQNEVPTNEELNRLLARSDAEFVKFQQLDREHDWPGQIRGVAEDVPDWLQYNTASLAAAALSTFKKQPATGLLGPDGGRGRGKRPGGSSNGMGGRGRPPGRPPSLVTIKKAPSGGTRGGRGRGGPCGGGRTGASGGRGGAAAKAAGGGGRGRPPKKGQAGGAEGGRPASSRRPHADQDSDEGGDDDVMDLSEGAPEEEREEDYDDFLEQEPAAAEGEEEEPEVKLEPSYSRMSIKDEDDDDTRSVGGALANFGGEMDEEDVPFDDNVMLDPEDIIGGPTRSWETYNPTTHGDGPAGAGATSGMPRTNGNTNGAGTSMSLTAGIQVGTGHVTLGAAGPAVPAVPVKKPGGLKLKLGVRPAPPPAKLE